MLDVHQGQSGFLECQYLKKSKQIMRFYTDSSSFVINLFHVLFMQFVFCFLCHSFVCKFLHHCSFVIVVFILVLILLLATRLLKLHFKKQIFNYYGVFCFYDDVKWFCSYVNKCQTFIDISDTPCRLLCFFLECLKDMSLTPWY